MINASTVTPDNHSSADDLRRKAKEMQTELSRIRKRLEAGEINEEDHYWVSPLAIVTVLEVYYRTMELIQGLIRDQRRLEGEHHSLVDALCNAGVFPGYNYRRVVGAYVCSRSLDPLTAALGKPRHPVQLQSTSATCSRCCPHVPWCGVLNTCWQVAPRGQVTKEESHHDQSKAYWYQPEVQRQ